MTTSGTYTYNPSAGDLVLEAFARCKIKRPALTREHMEDARMSANLLNVEWSNRNVNLWAVDLQSLLLTQGTATYNLPAETVTILDAYIATTSAGVETDRVIYPVSRTEFASFPNKATQGPPTVFWFDRTIVPSITLWYVPDGNGPYTLKYYRMRQLQDVVIPGGVTLDAPFRFLDAFAAGLARRLARKYAPELVADLAAEYKEAWDIASAQDTEEVPLYIYPGLDSYYR